MLEDPPISERMELPLDLSTPPVTTYGWWENDERLPYIMGFDRAGLPMVAYARRRKVFTTWREKDGTEMGRWEWRYQ